MNGMWSFVKRTSSRRLSSDAWRWSVGVHVNGKRVVHRGTARFHRTAARACAAAERQAWTRNE